MIVDEADHGLDRRSSSAIAKYADALRRISLAWRSSRASLRIPVDREHRFRLIVNAQSS
jgi:hypothetical protein